MLYSCAIITHTHTHPTTHTHYIYTHTHTHTHTCVYLHTGHLYQSVKGRDSLQFEKDKVSVTHTVNSDQKQTGIRKIIEKLEVIIY